MVKYKLIHLETYASSPVLKKIRPLTGMWGKDWKEKIHSHLIV